MSVRLDNAAPWDCPKCGNQSIIVKDVYFWAIIYRYTKCECHFFDCGWINLSDEKKNTKEFKRNLRLLK